MYAPEQSGKQPIIIHGCNIGSLLRVQIQGGYAQIPLGLFQIGDVLVFQIFQILQILQRRTVIKGFQNKIERAGIRI